MLSWVMDGLFECGVGYTYNYCVTDNPSGEDYRMKLVAGFKKTCYTDS